MKVHVIDAGHFKLDGGAMFGVVPKTLWQKSIPADDFNLCSWNMRCLLVENGKQLILIDTGMGDKQDARWQSFYFKHGEGDLLKSIAKAGFSPNEVTDVLLSHLHFDHCGGAVQWNTDRTKFELTFPNAKYWTHSEHWASAMKPNAREKATFLKENLMPIVESGHLFFTDKAEKTPFGEGIDLIYADGHTEKMIMPVIHEVGSSSRSQSLVFVADTVPSHAHVPIPYVMGYDIRPLQTMIEKEMLLQQILDNQWIMVFDHDPIHDAATVKMTEKGIRVEHLGKLREFI